MRRLRVVPPGEGVLAELRTALAGGDAILVASAGRIACILVQGLNRPPGQMLGAHVPGHSIAGLML